MSVSSPTHRTRRTKLARSVAWLALAGVAATSACVDLQEPWKKDKATGIDGSTVAPSTGGVAGGKTGTGIDGSAGPDGVIAPRVDGSFGTGGSVGGGGAIDGPAPLRDGPADVSLTGSGGIVGASQDGPVGTGGVAQGGAGGGPDVPLGGVDGGPAGGAGGTRSPDLARSDVNDTRPEAPADAGPDALTDVRGDEREATIDAVSTAGLVAYYPCEGPGGASGTTLLDLSGNGNHGTLAVGPAPSGGASGTGGTGGTTATGGSSGGPGFGFGTGKIGNGLALSGPTYGYVALPAGLLDGSQEMTVAAFVKVSGTAAFQRVFDFGSDTTNFMYLATTNTGNKAPRFRIVSASSGSTDGGVSQFIEGNQPVVAGAWTHVALVMGPAGVAIYVNGKLQTSSATVTLRPADLGTTTIGFIGRSEFPADPYLDGTVDEYRIYRRALSADEIAALAGG